MARRAIGAAAVSATALGIGAVAAAHMNEGPNVSKDAKVLRAIPLNMLGLVAHYAASIPVPSQLREQAYSQYCSVLGCDAKEAHKDLKSFRSLAEFFQRRIRADLRPIEEKSALVMPCDGHVIAAGAVGPYGSIDVKGIKYRIRDVIGGSDREPLAVSSVDVDKQAQSGSRLWYAVFNIGPQHSHHFASPTNWTINDRRHIEGYTFWMNPHIDGLYSQNERLSMVGTWEHGLFALTAVGAAGRGSIVIDADSESFCPRMRPNLGRIVKKSCTPPMMLKPGEGIGHFRLGSAIVLLFEAPEEKFKFLVHPGDSVKLGQGLAMTEKRDLTNSGPQSLQSNAKPNKIALESRARFRRAW